MSYAPLLLAALGSSAVAADKKVPGTSVSYRVQTAGGNNTSMVFVDAANERSGKTYLAVKCGGGSYSISLHSRDPLAKSEGALQVIAEQSGEAHRADGLVRIDRETGKVTVWDALGDANEGMLVSMFQTGSPMKLTVQRVGLAPLTYTFRTNGIVAALDAVNRCH